MSDFKAFKPLRLMAADEEDLKVVSACLQDAVAKIGDFAYLPRERRFAFVANRFLWECCEDKETGAFARVRVGAHFDDVLGAKQQNLRSDVKEAIVELLAIRFEPGTDGAGAVVLDFAGGGAIRLEVEALNCEMRDLSAPWRTKAKPKHE
jgi:hypothetical protein